MALLVVGGYETGVNTEIIMERICLGTTVSVLCYMAF